MSLSWVLFSIISAAAGQVGGQTPTGTAPVDERPETVQDLRQEIDRQRHELEAVQEKLSRLEENQALPAGELDAAPQHFQPTLSFYGFFDLTLAKNQIRQGSLVSINQTDVTSFTQTSLNFYAASQLSEQLSALFEFRFSFMPQGKEPFEGTFERVSTEFQQPFLGSKFRYGSLTVDRAHMTYSFAGWLEVLAGRFLTPVGIWNVDHGSTVVIPMRQPQFMWNEMLPLAQTGLQLRGNGFLGRQLSLDYALTLSNGRGPADATFDVDENKGVGARLRLAYEKQPWSLSWGGTGYYGEISDYTKAVAISGDQIAIQKTTSFDLFETCLATDVLFQGRGLRLQGEFIWRKESAVKPKPLGVVEKLDTLGVGPTTTAYFIPSQIGLSYYVLVAYEIPLELLHGVRFMPYFQYDYYSGADLYDINVIHTLIGGLNVRLGAYAVLKVEYNRSMLDQEFLGTVNIYQSQLALAF